jgi:glycosyltransferase involved in cell wall biosynthesis
MYLPDALFRASPRLSPRPISLRSHAIYTGVALVFATTLACALLFDDLFAWLAGIIYISYDTALMLFVIRHASRAEAESVPRELNGRPTLGVIVTAHDEAAALPATLDALLRQDDPPDLILIADDGSTDGTATLLRQRYGLIEPAVGALSEPGTRHRHLRWLRLPHAGKAAALNAAIVYCATAIVVTVDADTQLENGATAAIRTAFANEAELVAAGGILVPLYETSGISGLLGRFQSYEYVRNIVARFAWMHAGTLLLVSGAFAVFRRDALTDVGGFDTTALVEDYEVIHRLHRYAGEHGHDWRVRILGDAIAHTEAPQAVLSFLRQRRRWFGGFLQTQWWNRDMTGDPRFGRLGTSLLPVKAIDTVQPLCGLLAAALLLLFAMRGQTAIVVPALALIATKIGTDIAFTRWAIGAYLRLTADRAPHGHRPPDLFLIVEPFSFMLLRQVGAAWGWLAFLGGRMHWGRRSRSHASENARRSRGAIAR